MFPDNILLLLPWLAVAAMMIALVVASRLRRRPDNSVTGITADPSGTAYELSRLKNRAADHATPDAIVRVANGFDRAKTIHLVVYNHGFYTDIRGAYRDAELAKQMFDARPNTILFLPEWQKTPGAASSDQGRFSQPNLFREMVNEAFSKVDVLKGLTIADVERITILGHSAGYGPSKTELYNNGLGKLVVNVTLLDALYDRMGFDLWLKENIKDLSSGRKRFYNFFYASTAKNTRLQAAAVKKMLADAGLSDAVVKTDYDQGGDVLDSAAVAAQSVLFKYNSVSLNGKDPHYAFPNLYVRASVLASQL